MKKLSSIRGEVRAFKKEDIPQVAELHRAVFATADQASAQLMKRYERYFAQTFLNDAWLDDDTQSLVHEEDQGRITGFFGAIVRRMSFNGRPVRVKLGSQAVVEPGSRGLPGLKLFRGFLEGSHDLFMGDEASVVSRHLWEGFGGTASFLYSMYWLYALRPCRFGRSILTRKKLLPGVLSQAISPVSWTLDGLAAPMLRKLSSCAEDQVAPLIQEELTSEKLLSCLGEFAGKRLLYPDYDQHSLDWVLKRAAELARNDCLRKVLLKTERQEIAGWYIYSTEPSEITEVLQLYASRPFAHAVLEHLFRDAESRGAAVLRGRLEPSMVHAFSDKHCLFHVGPSWALFYSPQPDLLHALNRGDAFFSRLEGEWCLHFK
jgi:hypothetical protein